MANFTRTYHRTSYPSISPTRTALSQVGRTVLIAGGSTGIGFSISRAFVTAGVSRVILLGRRQTQLENARKTLLSLASHKLEVLTQNCDLAKEDDIKTLWTNLQAKGVVVDVLVLNAAAAETVKEITKEIDTVWKMYEVNTKALLHMVAKFFAQGHKKGKVLLNVSSLVTHLSPVTPTLAGMAATKAAFANLFQNIADETDVERAQMISFHPGTIFTEGSLTAGFKKDTWFYDDEDLAGHFAVWAASKEAAFLHGRFVWAHWDVDELMTMFQKQDNAGFLRMGLQGPEPLNANEIERLLSPK